MTLPINDQDRQVADYLKNCGIEYNVMLLQISHKRDDWESDKWLCRFGSEAFEYHTGIGHRVHKFGTTLPSKTREQMRELSALIGVDTLQRAGLCKETTERVRNPSDPTVFGAGHSYTIPPTQASVLYSIILDSEAATMTFSEWCDSFGYDTDSRKALATYEACHQNHNKLSRVMTSEQRAKIAKMLEDY